MRDIVFFELAVSDGTCEKYYIFEEFVVDLWHSRSSEVSLPSAFGVGSVKQNGKDGHLSDSGSGQVEVIEFSVHRQT